MNIVCVKVRLESNVEMTNRAQVQSVSELSERQTDRESVKSSLGSCDFQ
jgi:hypothetical protein